MYKEKTGLVKVSPLIIENKIKNIMANYLKKIWKALTADLEGGYDSGDLSAEQAWNLTRYNHVSIEDAVKKEILITEKLILYKTRIGGPDIDRDSTLIIKVPVNKVDIFDKVREHFKQRGFICFFEEFEELENQKFLIISWIGGGTEKKKEKEDE